MPPILILPTEILIEIFRLAMGIHDWSLARIGNLARTCRRWNSIIQSHSLLWAVVNGSAPIKDIKIAIRKAKTTPLALVCRYARWATLLSVLASTSPKFWSIDLEVLSSYLQRDWGNLSGLTSQVTHFRVHSSPNYHALPFLDISQGRKLRVLDLSWVVLDWDHPRLSGLVVLRLDGPRVSISPSQFRKILRASPSLEEVLLSYITLQPEFEEDDNTSDKIPLPSLQTLSLIAVQGSFDQVLPLLQIPPTATIRLDDVNIKALTVGENPALFQIIPPVLPSTPCIGVRITRDGCSLAVPKTSGGRIRHHINGQFGGISLLAPLQISCCGHLVARLDVDMRDKLDTYPVEGLVRLYKLQSLRVHGGSWVQVVLDFISYPVASGSEQEIWACPDLSELDVGFRSLGKNGWMNSGFHPGDGLVLQNLVSARWGGQDREREISAAAVARLDSLKVRVPETLQDGEDLDALASFACKSARVLGPNVLRIVSTVSCLQGLTIDPDHKQPPYGSDQAASAAPNRTPPILTLPTELIIEIFRLVVGIHSWSLARISNLARTCRRWNSIIRSHPLLWAVVNGNAPTKDIKIAIRKAKPTPLVLACRYPHDTPRWPNLLSALASTSPEFWSIDLEVVSHYLRRDWGVLFGLTSQVTHFRVHSLPSYPGPSSPFLNIPRGRKLRVLDLSWVVLDWDHPRLSGLVVLRLNGHLVSISPSQFRKILRASPSLEEILLSCIKLQPQLEADDNTSDKIPLPYLQTLSLIAVQGTFNQVLPLLQIPPTATIRLDDVDIKALTVGKNPALFRIIPPVLPSTPCIVARITRDGCSLAVSKTSGGRIRHHINGRYGGIPLLAPLQISCCGPLVARLNVDMRDELDTYPVEGLARLCNLQSLRVHGGSWVQSVLHFISRPLSTASEHEIWACPNLSDLDVGFRFPGKNGWMKSGFHPDDGLVLQRLVSTRWRGQDSETETPAEVARLDSLKVRVPETLEDEGDLDALASFACKSARILGPNVLRIVSSVGWYILYLGSEVNHSAG
ncbi:hypothetical protein FRC05_010244 [Tulasnella sp. 425]|nr:hypothetical protein FRC05_010244 [Tulasnella sp. 425]